jgi:hypothetical protein
MVMIAVDVVGQVCEMLQKGVCRASDTCSARVIGVLM